LYKFSQELFEDKFVSMTQDLLKRFGTAQQAHMKLPLPREVMHDLLGKHYRQRFTEKFTPASSIYYRFDQPLNGKQWYKREVNPDHGIFRWSGPETSSTLDLPLAADSDLQIQLEIIMTLAPEALDSLGLDINGNQIPLTSRQNEKGALVYEGIIPRTILREDQGFTQLNFRVNRTVAPTLLDPASPDDRKLGLAVTRIEVNPLKTINYPIGKYRQPVKTA
jgi:hypothetical protein